MVVVAAGGPEGRQWAAAGAAVLVADVDAGAVGELVASLRAEGARVAAFVGDASSPAGRSALLEMAAELFPGCEVVLET